MIRAKAENLIMLSASAPNSEILVYADGCTDDTVGILSAFSEAITVVGSDVRKGKTHGMNELVDRTIAGVLVFSDANVQLESDILERLGVHFSNPRVGCVCGNLVYTNYSESATAQIGSAYWRGEQSIKRLESNWGKAMGADGSLFAIRRDLYRQAPSHLIDDMYVSLCVLIAGYDVIQVDDVIAYERSASASVEEFRRKTRIACQAFNVHRALWPELCHMPWFTLYMYISHKLLRWFSVFFFAASGVSLFTALCLTGYAIGASIGACAAVFCVWAGHRWEIKPLSQIADIILALSGTGYGVIQSFRGAQYRTWEPADSIRR